jgi:hypothetical protein
MPDIAMCRDATCPSRRTCYRHKESGTVPNPLYQSYGTFRRRAQQKKCRYYWPVVEPSQDKGAKDAP